MLANHIWTVAGDDDRNDISSTFLQPFLAFTTPGQTTYTMNSESSYDWKNEQWSVPINMNDRTASDCDAIAGFGFGPNTLLPVQS